MREGDFIWWHVFTDTGAAKLPGTIVNVAGNSVTIQLTERFGTIGPTVVCTPDVLEPRAEDKH